MDTQLQFGTAKDHIKILYNGVSKLHEVAQRMMNRSVEEAQDMLIFGKELRYVIECSRAFLFTTPPSLWFFLLNCLL